MKYIITETQYNTIIEGNERIDAFQKLINLELKTLQNDCENDDEYSPEPVCYEISSIENIIVTNVESIKSEQKPKIIIKINIIYDSITYGDYDELIYQLKYTLRKSTGLPIDIQYETINLRSNSQW
jgi:hypothetical protein